MADSAFQTIYRDEFIAGFEQRQSRLRNTVTTEADINGNTAVFLVADSGGDEAVTRGINGLIPAKADNLNQYSCPLTEWHDLRRRTRYNIYASQGDGRRIMQMNSMAVMNRKIDTDIISALQAGTNDTGAAQQGSLDLVMWAQTILGNNDVEVDGDVSFVISPAFRAYLMQTKEFASADYVKDEKFGNRALPNEFYWAGVRFIVSTRIPGKGTANETCFAYHKNAIGHAVDMENLSTSVGYDEEQDYSFARTTQFMGSKLLQNSGVVLIAHDGSAYAAL